MTYNGGGLITHEGSVRRRQTFLSKSGNKDGDHWSVNYSHVHDKTWIFLWNLVPGIFLVKKNKNKGGGGEWWLTLRNTDNIIWSFTVTRHVAFDLDTRSQGSSQYVFLHDKNQQPMSRKPMAGETPPGPGACREKKRLTLLKKRIRLAPASNLLAQISRHRFKLSSYWLSYIKKILG